jgi:hypothetical protein
MTEKKSQIKTNECPVGVCILEIVKSHCNTTGSHSPLISVFYTSAATSLFKQLLNYLHEAERTPFQTHYYSENVVAPGIELGASWSAIRKSDH